MNEVDNEIRRRFIVARLTPRARSTSALLVYTDLVLPNTMGRTPTVWPLAGCRLLSWACCSYLSSIFSTISVSKQYPTSSEHLPGHLAARAEWLFH